MDLSNIAVIDTNFYDSFFYKDSLSIDCNEKAFKLFVEDKLWQGTFTIDGGWGNKNRIMNQVDPDVFDKENLPFFIEPIKAIKLVERDHYKLTTIGKAYKLLLLFIQKLISFGVEKQEYILNSFYDLDKVKEGSDVFQLKISVENKDITFTLTKMKWTPSSEGGLVVGRG